MSEHVYVLPAYTNTSVRFVIKGVRIKQAVLEVGGSKLGTVQPVYDDDWSPETITRLGFFGETPFRSALTKELNPQIHITSSGIPTMMMEVINDDINWNTVDNKFIESVVISTPSGEKTLNIAYLKHACGFIK